MTSSPIFAAYILFVSLHPSDTLPSVPRRIALLLRASHPEPAFAVTSFVTALAVAVGRGTAGSAAVAVAVLTGQLSVGWCNDAIDAGRDRVCGRRNKPVGSGELPAQAAATAAVAALALCVPLSLLSGIAAAAVHLAGVAAAWAYNWVLKRTVLSPLPYAFAFGSVPAFVTLGLPTPAWPAWWVMAATAFLGVGAHVANVLPDIDYDLTTGVRGLPQRLGRPICQWLAPLVMLTAMGILAVGPDGPVSFWNWVLGPVAGIIAVTGTTVLAGAGSRWPSRTAMIVGGIVVVQLLQRSADIA